MTDAEKKKKIHEILAEHRRAVREIEHDLDAAVKKILERIRLRKLAEAKEKILSHE